MVWMVGQHIISYHIPLDSHEWPMNISVDLNFWWLNQLFSSSQVHGHKAGWHGGRSAQGQLRCSDLNSNTDLMGYSWG